MGELMSLSGAKADIEWKTRNVHFWPEVGMHFEVMAAKAM